MDLFPTVLAASGTRIPADRPVDGTNLKTLLSGLPDPDHSTSFLMHFPHQHRSSYFTSLRLGDWKLIHHYLPEPRQELYQLRQDPYEKDDLADKQPERVKQMLAEMNRRLAAEEAQFPVDTEGRELRPQ
jgi:arylsulfatase A-like enzyme